MTTYKEAIPNMDEVSHTSNLQSGEAKKKPSANQMNYQISVTGRCFLSRWGAQKGYKSDPIPGSFIPSLLLCCTSISGKSSGAAGLWGWMQHGRQKGLCTSD